jgi:hypothetical protein
MTRSRHVCQEYHPDLSESNAGISPQPEMQPEMRYQPIFFGVRQFAGFAIAKLDPAGRLR